MFAIEAWYRRRNTASRGKPLPGAGGPIVPTVLTAEANGALFVTAANYEALMAGLTPGMALADARTLEPGLVTGLSDPAADAAMLDKLTAWCGRYTPWAAMDGKDGIWLDITGCAHLFGGEAALIEDLTRRLKTFGLSARAALADTPGAAWAMARYGAGGTGDAAGAAGAGHCVIEPGGQRDVIAAFPVAALRLNGGTAAALTRLGLATIKDLYPVPRASLAARFSRQVGERMDQALGRLSEPLSPRRRTPRYHARRAFAEAIGRTEDIEATILLLLDEVCAALDRAGQGCRQLTLDLFRIDSTVESLRVGTARPAKDAERLARLFAEPLNGLDTGFGIEAMTLSVLVAEPLGALQMSGMGLNVGGDMGEASIAQAVSLAPLLDRLGNRLGFERITTLEPQASHLPDRAVRAIPMAVGASEAERGPEKLWPNKPLRPLRILNRPESIEVVVGVAPHQPPSLFRWRKVSHPLRAAMGPERIAPEWWRHERAWTGGLRDYWRVEDCDGRRFWLFCEGGASGRPPRWYLHGLFA
jgi:protein ImuB